MPGTLQRPRTWVDGVDGENDRQQGHVPSQRYEQALEHLFPPGLVNVSHETVTTPGGACQLIHERPRCLFDPPPQRTAALLAALMGGGEGRFVASTCDNEVVPAVR